MDCLQDANKQHATKARSWGIEELSESGLLNLCCPVSYKPFEFVGGTWLQLFCSRVAILDLGRWKGLEMTSFVSVPLTAQKAVVSSIQNAEMRTVRSLDEQKVWSQMDSRLMQFPCYTANHGPSCGFASFDVLSLLRHWRRKSFKTFHQWQI